MKQHKCWLDEFDLGEPSLALSTGQIPTIEVSSGSPPASTPAITPTTNHPTIANGTANGTTTNGITSNPVTASAVHPRQHLLNAYTRGKIHDCLCWPSGGLTISGTLGWKMMEYLPFRRMDLQPDGSWKPIVWPLPCGEVRDIPDNVKIHNSVIRRMQADPKYRPGNLLVGGGGRGVRKAPESVGMGQWVVLREEGSLVGEVLVKRSTWEKGAVEVKKNDGGGKLVE